MRRDSALLEAEAPGDFVLLAIVDQAKGFEPSAHEVSV